MNFHKTIGFLATLLLVLGLGVPDSFAQTGTTTVELSRSSYVREGSSVVVTVTLDPAPAANTSVDVTLTITTNATPDPNYRYTVGDGTAFDPGATVNVGASGSGTVTLHIAEDDAPNDDDTDEFRDTGILSVTAQATTNHAISDAVTLPIRDNDDATGGDMKFTVSPPSYTAEAGAQNVTVTVELEEQPAADLIVKVNANVIATVAGTTTTVSLNEVNLPIERETTDNPPKPNKKGSATLPLPSDNDAEGTVEVKASAVDYNSATLTIPIITRDANDAEGFRVTIAPADGAWLGFGGKKVKVHVTRLDNTKSYPWTTFRSVAVSLRDTALSAHKFITVTANDLANRDGDIVFRKTQVDNNPNSTPDPAANNNAIAYSLSDDRLTFSIELDELTATTAPGVLGLLLGESSDGTKNNDAESHHPQAGITAKGQRMGVYATATFRVDDNTTFDLDSKDTKKKVFSNDANLGGLADADKVVGDGKLFKIDLIKPANTAVAADFKVRVGGTNIADGDGTEAKIGDEIEVAVGIAKTTRFLRDGGMQIQIQTIKNTDASGNANTATLKTANFSQAQISAVAGDSLRASLKLTAGLIKTPATAAGNTPDGAKLAKGKKFEPDYVDLRARVRTKDQAGNFSVQVKKDFAGDTRAPGISVLYPADGGRFTGHNIDTDFDKHLNPLKIRVDEDIDSLYVHVDGAIVGKLGDDNNASGKIILWEDENMDDDRGEIVKRAGATTVGDTITYETAGLKWKNAKGELKATGQGGTKVDLVVVAVDKVGNVAKTTLKGVTHDEKPPTITDWFPKNSLIEDDDNQINDATRHPVITLKEAVDSLSVTYDPSSGKDIVEVVGNLAKGDQQVMISEDFVDGRTYTLTIFARDLAGNAYETDAGDAQDMKFNSQFDNPQASMFTVKNISPAKSDSVVAGQALYLEIQAVDNNGTSDTKDDRDALTYKNTGSEVRVSAWAGDAAAESVMFHGGGVTDNGDGTATLNADGWKLGKRRVYAKSNKAMDLLTVMVEHRNAGEGGTSVVAFNGSIDSLYVDSADFAGFEITAWEDGVDGPAQEVWGDFTLKVVPVDKFGNPSVKAYKTTPTKGKNDVTKDADIQAATDSLAVLDTRVKDDGFNYKNGFDVNLRSLPDIGLPPFEWTIELAGEDFPVTAPSNRKRVDVQVRIDNTTLKPDDMRSQNVKSSESITVAEPLSPTLSLSVPGKEGDQSGNDVVLPDDGITVTVKAAGFNAGSDVAFTKDGTAMDAVKANADGEATLDITMSEAGTVTVSATDGRFSTGDLSIVFVVPTRKAYTDASGQPVYLIASGDMTVGVDDFLAFVAAYGSSAGDDNYNLQADIDGDGDVDVDDFLAFVGSYGRTATGPATKPLVLLPGINENAEFSLSLGSERVVSGELVAVDVSLANVEALIGYGFALNYDATKFEFVSVAPADEDLLKSTGGETLFHHVVADGQIAVANGLYNGTAVSGGGNVVRFVFRVLHEFEDIARFEIADGLVFDPSQLQNPAVVAGVLELQSTPREFALHQNFPNPFNPDTTIKYDLAESADVTLQIYNVLGQVVRTLVASEAQNAGRYQIRWNGMDDRGVPVSSGVYFFHISADGKFNDVRKLMLLK